MNENISVDPRRWWALVVVLAATLMSIIDASIVNVAIPSIHNELHTNTSQIQLVVVGYVLAYAIGLVTGGRLGDMFGRKRMFQLGMLVFTIASLLCGLAPNPGILILSRVVQGFGSALMVPQVISIIQVGFLPAERPVAFSMYGAVVGFASVFGQILGGLLIGSNFMELGWRNVFLVNVPIGVFALVASVLLVRESLGEGTKKLDLIGVGLLTLSLVLLTYPLSTGEDAGWPWWSFVCLILTIPLFVIFARYEQRLTQRNGAPLLPISLFSDRRFTLGLITALTFYGTNAALFFILSLFVQDGHNFTPLLSGLAFAPLGAGFLLSSLAAPRMITRLGLQVLYYGVVLILIGDIGTIFIVQALGISLHSPLQLVPFIFLIGVGQGFIGTPLINVVLTNIAHRHAGAASGAITTANQVSQALGVALIGVVFFGILGVPGKSAIQLSMHYNQAFIISIIALIGMSILTLVFLVLLAHVPQKTREPFMVAGDERIEEMPLTLGGMH
ncbi:MFS transporter [Ktedonobacteria bacterium brp13]|nr:MFS transporter [Ktedonobacteria bacterium brp13]